ncbi:MAG TPA: hypothetical protein VK638_38420 [Edaphobacter sp.]|nr:hypothetical protein [Edaphobacter sp.]
MIGLLLAVGASHFFASFTKDLPRVEEITLNWRIVAYSLACALITTLVGGLFPALRTTRRDLLYALGQSGRTQVRGNNPLPGCWWGALHQTSKITLVRREISKE